MPPPQPSIQITPVGWFALLGCVGIALGLRIALPIWFPDQFAAEGRNDPRRTAQAYPFMLVPLLFAGVAMGLRFLGYPVFRFSAQSSDNEPPDDSQPK